MAEDRSRVYRTVGDVWSGHFRCVCRGERDGRSMEKIC